MDEQIKNPSYSDIIKFRLFREKLTDEAVNKYPNDQDLGAQARIIYGLPDDFISKNETFPGKNT